MRSLLFFSKQLFQYRFQLLLGVFLSLILALSSIALLSLSGWFISSAAFAGLTLITATHFNYFIPAASIRFLALIRILSRYFDRTINHDYTFRILANLRTWFYAQLIPLAPAHLLKKRSGDLLNRIVHDIDTLDQLYLNMLSPVFISLVAIVVITLFIAHFSFMLSLSILGMIVFSLFLIGLMTIFYSQKIGTDIQQSTALLRICSLDFLQGFIDFLLFIKKENRLKFIHVALLQLTLAQKKLSILKGFAISGMQLFSGITVFVVLMIGIPLVNRNVISGAILAMIILMIIVTYEQLLMLPTTFLALGKTMEAANRLRDITLEKPAVVFCSESVAIKNYDLRINDVCFSYQTDRQSTIKSSIQLPNLSIPFHSKLGITGPSGSGKTTLAYLLTRIYDPISGEITIDNINLKKISEDNLRKTISLVTQRVHIFSASVRDNLTLLRDDISDQHCYDVLEKMEMADVIRALPEGLNTWMGEFGNHFSGGQIRRIAIARALLANTPILILDEPSTGLEKALMQRIWKNCESDFQNKTVIVMTHDKALLKILENTIQLKFEQFIL